jgi:hypothetical protein
MDVEKAEERQGLRSPESVFDFFGAITTTGVALVHRIGTPRNRPGNTSLTRVPNREVIPGLFLTDSSMANETMPKRSDPAPLENQNVSAGS